MSKSVFDQLVRTKTIILDGATGTEFIKRGMPQGVCPELWALENPQAVNEIHNAYAAAGSDIVYVPTFGANRLKLEEFGLAERTVEINRKLAESVKANLASEKTMAFGDLAPTGQFVEPFGDLAFESAVEVYKEQVEALVEGGVDGFAIETMMDIQEARAALIAVKETCDLPVMVTMTFDEHQRTLTGNDPLSALVTLQALGADAFGCNCSTGPENMIELIKEIKPYATIPLLAKPNAGMPKLINNKTVFDMTPDEFAGFAEGLTAAGANIIGGCCGTTPEHIAAQAVTAARFIPVQPLRQAVGAVSGARGTCLMGQDQPFRVIGERINPTGKKALQAELREGSLAMVKKYAAEQESGGAAILDVNMGLSGIDEKDMMLKSVSMLAQASVLPLCIDSTRSDVIEAALRLYPGRALVNSISLEKDRILETLPIAAKYGAMFILLPLTDKGIPDTSAKRIEVIKAIFAEAQKYGYQREDITVDALIMTISSNQEAAKVSLEVIDWCASEFGVNTACGLSNVSFGMPERKWINAGFLGMALGQGLNMAIANPSSEMLMNLIYAADVITGRDHRMRRYVEKFGGEAGACKKVGGAAAREIPPLEKVFNCVVEGDEESIESCIAEAMTAGKTAKEIVDESLIPAINKVGDLYDCKKYFLPQLIMGADTMRKGFEVLEPHLVSKENSADNKAVVILATVEGDIHDIGKNIVALMLRNYGFDVVDLGKDVSASRIIAAVKEHDAKIVGLSALMTTTMIRMEDVIRLAKAEGLDNVRFLIGGAVVDQNFADQIGADAYAADAMDSVRIAQRFSS
ncbi:homocysteine S-methyltransferase family protein [Lentisphaerota bacterium ZTH]|nr:homocysteine S-methyltransferase family protein [Lentisphaerota bacterium]WET07529.1 homocysteine S-methyltransferase family protein [Lentisphaerota bacterium ZTH]